MSTSPDDQGAEILSNLLKMTELEDAVKSGDKRRSLVALRDYLAHELSGHRCKTCMMSQLRTGDTAALVLRLTTIINEINEMPSEDDELDPIQAIRARRN